MNIDDYTDREMEEWILWFIRYQICFILEWDEIMWNGFYEYLLYPGMVKAA